MNEESSRQQDRDTDNASRGFEFTALKGANVKNLVVTVICTATIVWSIGLAYNGIISKISDVNNAQGNYQKINDLQISILKDEVVIINKRLDALEHPQQK